MLVRAARRKARPNAIRQTLPSERLYLPWLCPAAHREQHRPVSVDTGSQQTLGVRKRRNSRDGSSLPPRRTLATAMAYRPFDDIPFEGLNNHTPPPGYNAADSLSNLKPLEPSSVLMLGGSLATAPPKIRAAGGIGGQLTEILSILEACIHVGRIERAGAIMKRLSKLNALDVESMLELHNRFLRSSVEQIMLQPSESATQAIHKWFELEIRLKGIPHNDETLAYMLKASLYSPPGKRLDRLVKRYMDMAPEENNAYKVLLHDIFTPKDLDTILQICPQLNSVFREELEPMDDYADIEHGEVMPSQLPQYKPVPDVRAMPQKGLGLKALQHSLSHFRNMPTGLNSTSLNEEDRREFQKKVEADAVESAIERWREEGEHLKKMGMDTALQTKSLGARMWRWQNALEERLKVELVKIDEAETTEKKNITEQERCQFGPFLRYLPVDKLAATTIVTAMTGMTKFGVDKGLTLTSSIMDIAQAVEDESLYEKVRRTSSSPLLKKMAKRDRSMRATYRASLRKLVEDNTVEGDEIRSKLDGVWDQEWPAAIRAKVGAFLMSALIETAKIPVTMEHPETKELVTQLQPAFIHGMQYKLGKKVGVIHANSVLVKQLKREPVHSLLAKHLPMLVKPEPWTLFNKGGYLVHPSKVMRIKLGDKDQRHYAEAAILKGDMNQTFRGLDVLGKTAWRVNQPVFDVMLEVWNSGEAVANIAPENPQLETPPEPEPSRDPAVRRRWIQAVKVVENVKSGLHSQRCFQNFQLEIARALRNEDFYFPHNVDFRGRAYPIPPYLNHMGADHCRGLLKFARGRELGESGLRWLKIHLANVFGFDKASLKERESFAIENLSEIYDSATNSLSGNRWWLKAEDPWQCLAACIELKNALDSAEPTKYVSHLPIHQDGTCNGLQHYAALGGDESGAKQVNLEPGDRPGDVYSAVADLVKKSIAEDVRKGNPFAKILDGKITRKTVKQTVMTNVYGVTFIGAKAQVRRQLDAAYPDLPNTPSLNPGLLSSYTATKIFTSLSTMFRGAHDIQYWLGECASRISTAITAEQMDHFENEWSHLQKLATTMSASKMTKHLSDNHCQFKSSVIWTNPLHMPVVQPYRTSKARSVTTNLQRINLSEPHQSDPVSKRKQLQAFPPNFIHSLDATHMLLSALQCDEMGLNFAAVHDSFWTHAADIEAMNSVLRDTFVRIHSEDVIGRLAAEFSARYKSSMYLAKVQNGTPLHKKITELRLENRYMKKESPFWDSIKSLGFKLKELMTERERLRLLNSSDPKDVAKGKQMVTPGSIYDQMAAEGDLVPEEDLTDLGLGSLSTRQTLLAADEELQVGDLDNVDEVHNPLPGGTEEDAALCDTVDGHDDLEDSVDEADVSPPSSSSSKRQHHTWVWLPLTFPPVPKKGDFDVTRLRSSQYFFS